MAEQKKSRVIFTPSAEQIGEMLENAWQDFLKQARDAGYVIDEESAGGWLKDTFAAGYALGYNDGFGIIKGQLDAINMENEMAMQQ